MLSRSRCLCLLLLVIPASALASAQEITRNEFTVGVNAQTFSEIYSNGASGNASRRYVPISAPSLTYTRNLSPSLALEGSFLPITGFRYTGEAGAGRETLALGGVKSGWRGKRWGIYGKVQAGVASFSCGDWYIVPKLYSNCTHLTDFALEYGGVAEYRLSTRYSLRVDAGHLMLTQFDHVLARDQDGLPDAYRLGAIVHHMDAQIGITRRFGALEEAQPERSPARQAWDAGVLFALQPRTEPTFGFVDPYPEWGIWASWNFSKYVSWDTSVLRSPRNQDKIEAIDYQAGGRAIEALTGVKIGIRRDHMGYFAVVRPGTITFSKTERQLDVSPTGQFKFDDGMFTDFVMETGGVYEVYPSRHSILRFEAGDAQIFYRPKNVISQGQVSPIAAQNQPSLLISFGAGFRF
jgi:hypothetical protein